MISARKSFLVASVIMASILCLVVLSFTWFASSEYDFADPIERKHFISTLQEEDIPYTIDEHGVVVIDMPGWKIESKIQSFYDWRKGYWKSKGYK